MMQRGWDIVGPIPSWRLVLASCNCFWNLLSRAILIAIVGRGPLCKLCTQEGRDTEKQWKARVGNLSLQLLNFIEKKTKFLSFIGASSACHAPLADASGSVAAPVQQHLCFGISRRPPAAPRPWFGAPRPWPPQSPGVTFVARTTPPQTTHPIDDGICTEACSMRFWIIFFAKYGSNWIIL